MHKYDADDNKHGNKGVRPLFLLLVRQRKFFGSPLRKQTEQRTTMGVKKIANHDQDPLVRTLVNLSSISYPSIKT